MLRMDRKVDKPYLHLISMRPAVSIDDVRSLCFDVHSLLLASKSMHIQAQLAEHPDGGGADLSSLHYDLAEAALSGKLHRLAGLIIVLQEINRRPANSSSVGLEADGSVMTIRQACTRIATASGFEPVYLRGENAAMNQSWYMSGEIELSGLSQGHTWRVSLNLWAFLRTLLALTAEDRRHAYAPFISP